MDVSENSGTPKSSNLIGFSIVNHPFWGTPIFGNTHIGKYTIHWRSGLANSRVSCLNIIRLLGIHTIYTNFCHSNLSKKTLKERGSFRDGLWRHQRLLSTPPQKKRRKQKRKANNLPPPPKKRCSRFSSGREGGGWRGCGCRETPIKLGEKNLLWLRKGGPKDQLQVGAHHSLLIVICTPVTHLFSAIYHHLSAL